MTPDQHSKLAHRIEYDDEEDLAFVVIEAVATISESAPDAIGPINDVLDPEALCELFAPRGDGKQRTGGSISFHLDGYGVTVDAAGNEVLVYE
jgi:hypothetical protein